MTRLRNGTGVRPDSAPSSETSAGQGLAAYWWTAYAGGTVIMLAIVLSCTALFSAKEERMVKGHLRAFSQVLATELSSRTAAVRSQLQRWRDDDALRAVLLDGRNELLRAQEEELTLLVPGVIGVNLLTAKDIEPGGFAGSLLSFAGVEMVRKVRETGEIARLEGHRVNQRDEHLAIAGPVMDASGQRVLGVVHLMLPLSMLPSSASVPSKIAQFQFRQQAKQRFVVIHAAQAGQSPSDALATQIPIDGTSLQLYAWGEPRRQFAVELLPWLSGIFGVALVLLSLLMWVSYRRLRNGMKADLASILVLIDDASNRRPLRTTRNCIAEFKPAQDELRRVLRDLPPARTVTPRAEQDFAALAGAGEGPEETMELEFDGEIDLGSDSDSDLDLDLGSGPASSPALPLPRSGADESLPSRSDQSAMKSPPRDLSEQRPSDAVPVSSAIFRAYDVRGLVGSEITPEVMRLLGLAVGTEALLRGDGTCIVARDQRPSGESLSAALVAGLRASGCDVIDLGMAPTPVLYFAAHDRGGSSAAMVTASHNPAEYNGLKVVFAGRSATREEVQSLHERIKRGEFNDGDGDYTEGSVFDDYVEEIETDVALARPLKVVLDCGHAAAALIAPRLFHALGCEVIELDCDLDPALADVRMPDPSKPQSLYALGEAVVGASADVGLAFDADGDRLGVVDSAGHFIAIDRVLMLLAADVLARLPGSDIVYDVKCSHQLGSEILNHGGRPVMWRSGHSYLKEKMRELSAPLGGELSGHIVFSERWNGFDDALYAGARLLEVLALDPRASVDLFAELPIATGTPELFMPLPAGQDQVLMEAVLGMADRLDGVEVSTIDGLRAQFDHGWGLVRASNTQPGLVFRFQADEEASLAKIENLFRRMMELVAPDLDLPF